MGKKNKNIDEMFGKIDNSSNLTFSNTTETKKRKSRVAVILVATLGVVGLGIGGAIYLSGQKTVKVDNSVNIRKATASQTHKDTYTDPVELPDYLKTPYTALSDEQKVQLRNSLDNKLFGDITSSFPSEEEGFTSDRNKIFDENGFPNMYYTTMTRENFKYTAISYINRMINPIYGDWVAYQYGKEYNPSDFADDLYSDMFSKSYKDKLKDKSKLPFFFDVDCNDYGYKWIDGRNPRFIGKIKDIKDLSTNDLMTKASVTAKVSLYGNTKNKGKVVKNYDITISLISDKDEDNLVIDSVSIKDNN